MLIPLALDPGLLAYLLKQLQYIQLWRNSTHASKLPPMQKMLQRAHPALSPLIS